LLLLSYVFLVAAKSRLRSESSAQNEALIRRELDRFAEVQGVLAAENLNLTVIFSRTARDDNDTVLQHDAVQFRPISTKYNPNGKQLPDKINEEKIKEMFDYANSLNMSAIISREIYSQDGSLQNKAVYAEDIKVSYDDGKSTIVITDSAAQEDDDQFESFVNMLKQYELPVVVHKTLYNEQGEVLKTDSDEYYPRKVSIVDGNMQTGRKLNVAEAVKRVFTLKEDNNDRLILICKYLGIQFPKFSWQSVIGDGAHHVYKDEWVKLVLEGQTYTIIANKN